MASAKLNLMKLGMGGVNLTKSPLHAADDELTQAQNAEIVEDEDTGGDGALTKRGGLAALTSALAGDVLGMHGLPLLTTYTRTLYAARGTEDSNTWMSTTNGTSWTDTSTPVRAANIDKYADNDDGRAAARTATYKNNILYPGNNYTQDTDNPEISFFDGTNSQIVSRINISPSGNASPPFVVTDMLVANGKVYVATQDPTATAAPNLSGRVLELDPVTGTLRQLLNAFGGGTGEVTGGYPAALAWWKGQLWVGLNGGNTTNGIGKIVRAFPDVATSWTSDVTNLSCHITSLVVFLGDLYATSISSASTGARIHKKASSGTAWTTQVTSASGAGDGYYSNLYVYSSALYAVEYFNNGTDVVHIVRSTDGTTFSTDRDVDANDSTTNPPQVPGMMVQYGDDLYASFKCTTATGTDGFIMRRASGTWTKVVTDNLSGMMAVLVART